MNDKRTMKKAQITYILFICTLALSAQNNYKPGYIIGLQQDTLYGFINLRTDKMNMRQCSFKKDETSGPVVYRPEDIFGYRFTDEGKYYVARDIEIKNSTKRVFLEYLVKGVMNLYYYKDEDDLDYYFFEKEDGKLLPVTRKPDNIENRKVIVDNQYKGVVRHYFKDVDVIADKVGTLKFNQKSMITVARQYHDEVCTTGEECIVFQNQKPDSYGYAIRFSAYTGLYLVNYRFHSYGTTKKSDFNAAAPLVGGRLEAMNTRWSDSFSILLDASLGIFAMDEPAWLYGKSIDCNILPLSVRLGIKYVYPKYRLRPAIEAAPAFTYLFPLTGDADAVDIKRRHFGYYLAMGADYAVGKQQSVFVRLVYENYPFGDRAEDNGQDKLLIPHVKVGYRF